MSDIKKSKFLSLVLRHEPELLGLTLDEAGWVSVDLLLRACAARGRHISRQDLERIVATNDKKRFALSDDGRRIRANQGHSVEVKLGLEPQPPPEHLFHGTASRFIEAIRAEGLQKQARHHVHLSADIAIASAVGQRHGKSVILTVLAGEMHRQGHAFYRSENGVWLADSVPIEFLQFPPTG